MMAVRLAVDSAGRFVKRWHDGEFLFQTPQQPVVHPSLIKNGPAYAIAHTPSPITVIPVYHHGIERIFSKGGPKTRGLWRWLPRSIFRRPIVMFGQPIDFSECFRITAARERITAINRRIVASIASLQSLAAA